MSYILDALRKSDQQRQHGTSPTLHTTRLHSRGRDGEHGWLFAILGVLLMVTGIGIGWLHQWESAPIETAVPSAGKPTLAKPPDVATPAPIPAESVLMQKPHSPADASSSPRRAASAVANTKKEAAPRDAPALTTRHVVSSSAALAGKALAMSELPLAVQQEIPPMAIAVHAYSPRPADRMVSINNSLLREGATVQPGLTLDEITPDGMVFNYKGYRFKRGVQN